MGWSEKIWGDLARGEVKELGPFEEKWLRRWLAYLRWGLVPTYLFFRSFILPLPAELEPLMNTAAFRWLAFVAFVCVVGGAFTIGVVIRIRIAKTHGFLPDSDSAIVRRLSKGLFRAPLATIAICELLIDAFFLFDL
jgi:hypothetical protein